MAVEHERDAVHCLLVAPEQPDQLARVGVRRHRARQVVRTDHTTVLGHARIVDGPNAAGAYLIATPPGQAEVVRHALRESRVVSMAERLAPPE